MSPGSGPWLSLGDLPDLILAKPALPQQKLAETSEVGGRLPSLFGQKGITSETPPPAGLGSQVMVVRDGEGT